MEPATAADVPGTTREELRRNHLRGDYNGLELQQVEWLRNTVPVEYRQRDDLKQQVAYYTLEAIDLYNPNHVSGMKFSTFLVQHLRLRCGNYQQYLWVRSSGNERCRMRSLSAPADVEQSFNVRMKVGARENVAEKPGSPLTVRSDAESICHVNEMVAALSDEARDYLNLLFSYEDQDALVKAFQSQHFRSKVSLATGLSKRQVEVLANEVREKLPMYMEL